MAMVMLMVIGVVTMTVRVFGMTTVMAIAFVMRSKGKGNGYSNGCSKGNGNGEALFSRSSLIVICGDVVVYSRCTQHPCNTRLCGRVLNCRCCWGPHSHVYQYGMATFGNDG
jgi:hypothetical protein